MTPRQDHIIRAARDKIVERLATTSLPQRAVKAVVTRLLLDAPYIYNGLTIDPKIKSIGAGVYEITR
jgi:hypothetical protein